VPEVLGDKSAPAVRQRLDALLAVRPQCDNNQCRRSIGPRIVRRRRLSPRWPRFVEAARSFPIERYCSGVGAMLGDSAFAGTESSRDEISDTARGTWLGRDNITSRSRDGGHRFQPSPCRQRFRRDAEQSKSARFQPEDVPRSKPSTAYDLVSCMYMN